MAGCSVNSDNYPDSIADEAMGEEVQRLTFEVDCLKAELTAVLGGANAREECLRFELKTLGDLNQSYKARVDNAIGIATSKSRDVSSLVSFLEARLKEQQDSYEKKLHSERKSRQAAEAEVKVLKAELAKRPKSTSVSPRSTSGDEMVLHQGTTGSPEALRSPSSKSEPHENSAVVPYTGESSEVQDLISIEKVVDEVEIEAEGRKAERQDAEGRKTEAKRLSQAVSMWQVPGPPVSDRRSSRQYPADPSVPDIKNPCYCTDEFRMYSFKVASCARAYSHDWTDCPFAHPGENARRRDPKVVPYSSMPCPDFKKQCCKKGEMCEYAHGVFEVWLHPNTYKTRFCKEMHNCVRTVCFFAHTEAEKRRIYTATGCALPSPGAEDLMDMQSLGLGPDAALMSPASRLHPQHQEGWPSTTPPRSPIGGGPGPSAYGGSWAPFVPNLNLPNRLRGGRHGRDGPVNPAGAHLPRPRGLEQESPGREYSMPPRSPITPGYHRRGSFSHLGLQIPTSPPSDEPYGEGMGGGLLPNHTMPLHSDSIHRHASATSQLLQEYLAGNAQNGSYPPSPAQNAPRQVAVGSERSMQQRGGQGRGGPSSTPRGRTPTWRDPQARVQGGPHRPAPSPRVPLSTNVSDWSSPKGEVNWGGVYESSMWGYPSPAGAGDPREGGWGQGRGGMGGEMEGKGYVDHEGWMGYMEGGGQRW